MTNAELETLDALKREAARKHDEAKRALYKQIAHAVLSAPNVAIDVAHRALKNRTEVWQQWSRTEWEEILATWSIQDIARLLSSPRTAHQEMLVDCHPFPSLREIVWSRAS